MVSTKRVAGRSHRAVLFDLDGTLVDTAPDMVAVLTRLQLQHGQPVLSYDIARNNVSNGAMGLLKVAFPDATAETLAALNTAYLDDYSANLCQQSSIFVPLAEFLQELRAADRVWGVVTNKPQRMTLPLMDALGIRDAAACIISGDTLPQRKPHPEPLLHAARLAEVAPDRTLYVGDARRDIEAGNAAGMTTIAVGYGYITPGDDPECWGASHFVPDTLTLIHLLRDALDLTDHA